ncbi:MAG: XkdF-like putative serine protease domain-containing protein [Stellaceae bacterium]
MKIFVPIAKLDDEQRLVYGYATTEALDAHGEVVKREAIEAALPHYMRFANIREMHQLSAVGVAKEAEFDEKGLYLKAKVVDDEAWAKVKEGVYKGFSIGGRVTQRDAADRKLITGVELNEISLVDRPANPEAMIEAFKVWGDPALKIGARNSKADLERIQRMHDTAVELGASCGASSSGADDAPDAEDDESGADEGDDMTEILKTQGRQAVLAKVAGIAERMSALAKTVEEQGRLLQRLAAEPAQPKYLAARAVEKAEDGRTDPTDDAPKTALDAIKKAHRNPVRLGLG